MSLVWFEHNYRIRTRGRLGFALVEPAPGRFHSKTNWHERQGTAAGEVNQGEVIRTDVEHLNIGSDNVALVSSICRDDFLRFEINPHAQRAPAIVLKDTQAMGIDGHPHFQRHLDAVAITGLFQAAPLPCFRK